MTSRKLGLWRRLTAVVAVSALSVLGMAGTAQAADNVGNIDSSKSGSIVIHKFDGSEGTDGGNGSAITDTSGMGKPLSGVGFTVEQVTAKGGQAIDLTKSEGWDAISGLQASEVTAGGFTTVDKGEKNTDGNGNASFGGLPLGLYLVTETTPPANATATTAPFLVTLPLSQDNGKWTYDVNVYPKNSVNDTTPTKTVANPTAPVLGSTVDWTITAPVPRANHGYSSFVITDKLDERLSFQSASLAGFTPGNDYTVSESNGTVKITFTAAGLKKLKAGNDVVATITTKVTSQGDGTIENTALVNVNDSNAKTPQVSSNWGSLSIHKFAKGDKANSLAGAEFEIYSDSAATKSVGKLTTKGDGTASITLWVGNNDDLTQKYWVKESKAPAGYVLNDTVNEVTVKAGASADAVVFDFPNTQQGHPNLPLTGADGKMLAMIAGIGLMLIAGGAAIIVANRRKNQV